MTFKKQHVDIDIQKLWELYTPEYRREGEKPMRPIFPASLHVNHESRTETLRYYCILPPTEPRTGPSAHHPVCLNPSLDSCYLRLKSEIESGLYDTRHYIHHLVILHLILRFTGLKRVCFTWTAVAADELFSCYFDDMKECRETIQAFFEKNKDVFIGGKAPEVEVRLWMEKEKVYICSTRNGEKLLENPDSAALS
jgi:hypothetical protein